MPTTNQNPVRQLALSSQANGFILLEVLVAMSLVASSWMALSNTYQGVILRLGQVQEKRAELRKEMDRHELAMLAATQLSNLKPVSGKIVDESLGMSRRSRPIASPGRTTHKK